MDHSFIFAITIMVVFLGVVVIWVALSIAVLILIGGLGLLLGLLLLELDFVEEVVWVLGEGDCWALFYGLSFGKYVIVVIHTS